MKAASDGKDQEREVWSLFTDEDWDLSVSGDVVNDQTCVCHFPIGPAIHRIRDTGGK